MFISVMIKEYFELTEKMICNFLVRIRNSTLSETHKKTKKYETTDLKELNIK